ncbi:MAG: hypothetical protein R3A10_03385 [Caldilineaceae bacterium]
MTLVERNGAPGASATSSSTTRRSTTSNGVCAAAACWRPRRSRRAAMLAGAQTIVFGRARQTTGSCSRIYATDCAACPAGATRGDRRSAHGVGRCRRSRGRRAVLAAATCPWNAAPSKPGCAAARCALWSPPTLELGIDIGRLQAAVLCGYPGSIAGTWQQIGRAGRTTEAALAVLVATGGVLDQYVAQHRSSSSTSRPSTRASTRTTSCCWWTRSAALPSSCRRAG